MIYVMRHGESTLNVERLFRCRGWSGDLTDRGRDQARKAGEWLRDKTIHQIFYSPFDRTQQTADVVGEILGLTPGVDHDLSEVDCGDKLEEVPYEDGLDDFLAIFFRWLEQDEAARFPGGESYGDAFNRFSRVLRRLGAAENTLLVTHGGITRAVIPPLCVNGAALQGIRPLDYTGFALLEPYDTGRFSCEAWNLVEHLG